MGVLMDSFNAMIEMERQYGNTTQGDTMIKGVMDEVVGILPDPFPIGLFGIKLDLSKISTCFHNIQGHIKTYVNFVTPTP